MNKCIAWFFKILFIRPPVELSKVRICSSVNYRSSSLSAEQWLCFWLYSTAWQSHWGSNGCGNLSVLQNRLPLCALAVRVSTDVPVVLSLEKPPICHTGRFLCDRTSVSFWFMCWSWILCSKAPSVLCSHVPSLFSMVLFTPCSQKASEVASLCPLTISPSHLTVLIGFAPPAVHAAACCAFNSSAPCTSMSALWKLSVECVWLDPRRSDAALEDNATV